MSAQQRKKAILLIVLSNVFEAILWGNLFYWTGTSIGWILLIPLPILHFLFVFLFAYGIHELLPRQPSCDEFSFGMGLIMPLSIPLLSISFLVYSYESPSRDFVDNFQETVFQDQSEGSTTTARGNPRKRLQIEPLEDLLHSNHPELHRDAVEKLGIFKNAQSTKLLKQELKNQDSFQRMYAYHELENLSLELISDLQEARDNVEASPEDESAHAKLGACYLRFWEIGLLEDEIETDYLKKAKSSFTTARSLSEEQHSYACEIGKTRFALNEYDRALDSLKRALAEQPNSKEVLFFLARTHFQLWQLKPLRTVIERLDERDLERPHLEDAVEYWLDQSPATH